MVAKLRLLIDNCLCIPVMTITICGTFGMCSATRRKYLKANFYMLYVYMLLNITLILMIYTDILLLLI